MPLLTSTSPIPTVSGEILPVVVHFPHNGKTRIITDADFESIDTPTVPLRDIKHYRLVTRPRKLTEPTNRADEERVDMPAAASGMARTDSAVTSPPKIDNDRENSTPGSPVRDASIPDQDKNEDALRPWWDNSVAIDDDSEPKFSADDYAGLVVTAKRSAWDPEFELTQSPPKRSSLPEGSSLTVTPNKTPTTLSLANLERLSTPKHKAPSVRIRQRSTVSIATEAEKFPLAQPSSLPTTASTYAAFEAASDELAPRARAVEDLPTGPWDMSANEIREQVFGAVQKPGETVLVDEEALKDLMAQA